MLGRYDRVTFRGFRFNRKTVRMIRWAERRAGFKFTIAQGSFNAGGVAASAGTHDGSALDVGAAGLSRERRTAIVHALKDAGFAAWYRSPADGFAPHIHAIPLDDKQVSSAARDQLVQYDLRRNALANNAPDRTYRPSPRVRWSYTLNRPVRRK